MALRGGPYGGQAQPIELPHPGNAALKRKNAPFWRVFFAPGHVMLHMQGNVKGTQGTEEYMKSTHRRAQGRQRHRLVVFRWVALALAPLGLLVAAPALSQAGDSSGRGTVTAKMTENAPMTFPGPCLHFHVDARSDPGYRGTYVATDNKGGKHTYNGDLTTTLVVDTNETPYGTHQAADCSDGTGEYEQPIKSANLTSPAGGPQSVACNYTGTYNIRGARDITVKLNGTCNLNDQGTTYTLNTTETRRGQISDSSGTPPTQIKWTETYTASTTCTSPSCNNPGPTSPSSGRPVAAPPKAPSRVTPPVAQTPGANEAPPPPPVSAPELAAPPPPVGGTPEDQFSDRGLRASNDSEGVEVPGTPLILLVALGIAAGGTLGANWINGRRLISWPLPWPSRR